MIGYLIYLEALSSKPGTYMVQTMFPALALAVAIVVTSEGGAGKASGVERLHDLADGAMRTAARDLRRCLRLRRRDPRRHPRGSDRAGIASLFIWSGQLGREGHLRRWSAVGVAALGLFAITLLGIVLPGVDKIWPARQIAKAVASCPASDTALIGFREPSGRFLLASPNRSADAGSSRATRSG